MSKTKKIQRFETWRTELPIYCPFCGIKTYSPDEDSSPVVGSCEHVLFVAHDEGFEFRSERFDALMKIIDKDDEDIETGDTGYDGFTDKVELADSIKFAIYTPAPSFFGLYIGFAPTDDE